jgi:hypothetical protein
VDLRPGRQERAPGAEEGRLHCPPGHQRQGLGINLVTRWLRSGRLKIVRSLCPNLCSEAPRYRYTSARDGLPESEEPINEFNHGMDAMRYNFSREPAAAAARAPGAGGFGGCCSAQHIRVHTASLSIRHHGRGHLAGGGAGATGGTVGAPPGPGGEAAGAAYDEAGAITARWFPWVVDGYLARAAYIGVPSSTRGR